MEFGLLPDGTLMLADEVLTPDSSRFWLAEEWQPGRPQRSLDKQFLRDWSAGLDWDRRPPGPAIPPDVVAATQARYQELYARITPVSDPALVVQRVLGWLRAGAGGARRASKAAVPDDERGGETLDPGRQGRVACPLQRRIDRHFASYVDDGRLLAG